MDKITLDNFQSTYSDPIEEERIDKFVADEINRQVRRYIKAMSGSKELMSKFQERIATLSQQQKEEALARYIDFNRKITSGLDFKIVLVRAIANYSDTYDYFLTMLNDKTHMQHYLERIKSKYIRYHQIIEKDNKFGMIDYEGKTLLSPIYDFIRTCYTFVDDLTLMPVIAQKDGKMGLVLPDGKDTIVADFVYDDISIRDEYPCFEAKRGLRTELL